MKNSSDTIGNRSRGLPVCSAVPQPLHHRVPPLDQLHGINIGYQLIAQMFINICFVYFVIVLPHVWPMTAILQGKFSYKGIHIVISVVKDVHK
jgi:hypothetical protein